MNIFDLLRKSAVEQIRPGRVQHDGPVWRVQLKSDTGQWADIFTSEDPADAVMVADQQREAGARVAILIPISPELWRRVTAWSGFDISKRPALWPSKEVR